MIERLVQRVVFAAAALMFAASAAGADDSASWSGVERIVVIGDLHGDLEKFDDMLAQAGLTDEDGDWAGGRTHLVQLGDVPDRGDHTRAVIDRLMTLERQARRAGGRVHALVGNHEAMNVAGDLRYTTPGEFEAFATRRSRRVRDQYYDQVVDYLRANPPEGEAVVIDAAFRAQWEAEHPLGWVEHRRAWAAGGDYGRWAAGNDTIIRINDTLFVHGGVGPAYAHLDRGGANAAVRSALSGSLQEVNEADILWSEEGPLWYRGFAHHDEAEETAHLETVLARHGVSRVIVGHTPIAAAIMPRFDGRVIIVDAHVAEGGDDPRSFLTIEAGQLSVVHRGQEILLEPGTPAGVLNYLQVAAELDPAPSPLLSTIAGLSARPPSP